jgi:GNAT superfamily N-acetyltransferase
MTVLAEYEIARGTPEDIPGILDLQRDNLPDRGGTLSVPFPREEIATAIDVMPVIVARRDGRVVGYLMVTPLAAQAQIPIWQALLRIYQGAPEAYAYGPICVADSMRGRGVASAMFGALRRYLPSREGILFIRRDNAASLRAHHKMGMRQVAEFTASNVAYVALSYVG